MIYAHSKEMLLNEFVMPAEPGGNSEMVLMDESSR